MKYENRKRAKEICELIDKQQELLKDFEADSLYIQVRLANSFVVCEAFPKIQGQFAEPTETFQHACRDIITSTLASLHAELDTL